MNEDKAIASENNAQEWVFLYADDLFRRALYKTSNRETAEDLVQETFLAAFKSIEKFKGKSQVKTWLFSILNNKIIDYYRKNFKEATVSESQISSGEDSSGFLEHFFDSNESWNSTSNPSNWQEVEEHLLDNYEFKAVLQSCMGKLPSNWNSAIQLKYLEQKEGKLICQELGITPSNFWQILHRAKLQLKVCLENNWFKAS